MKRIALALLLILPSQAFAQTKIVVQISPTEGLLITAPGPVTVERIPIQQIGLIVKPPPVEPGNDRVKSYQREAEAAGDPANAKKLAALFLGLVNQIETGKIKDRTRLQQVTTIGLDLFLRDPTVKAKWTPFRDRLANDWIAAVQEGATMDQYAGLLSDVASGLDASADGQEAISIGVILEILELIMSEEKLTLTTILKILSLILGLGK